MKDAVGVDGCKGGWYAVAEAKGGERTGAFFATFRELLAAYPEAVVAVDMPIGLTDDGQRTCDGFARAKLPGRASCVFNAPARAVLTATDYNEAQDLSRAAAGVGVSQQSFHLIPKIREIDALVREDDTARRRVYETHPELVFARLAGKPMQESKRRSSGRLARLELLRPVFGDEVGGFLSARPHAMVGPDDVLDACAALLTARRIRAGEARPVPDPPERDGTGLAAAIWL